jgi:hypothetical protein
VNFPIRSYNYCMYSTTVDRHQMNTAQANYELAGRCINYSHKNNMYINWCVDPCPTVFVWSDAQNVKFHFIFVVTGDARHCMRWWKLYQLQITGLAYNSPWFRMDKIRGNCHPVWSLKQPVATLQNIVVIRMDFLTFTGAIEIDLVLKDHPVIDNMRKWHQ